MEQPGGYGKSFHRSFHDACKVRAAVFDEHSGLWIALLVPDVAWLGFTPDGGVPQFWLFAPDGSDLVPLGKSAAKGKTAAFSLPPSPIAMWRCS
jgi:hypothetical protein